MAPVSARTFTDRFGNLTLCISDWFFATGYGLVLGSLALKSYRIHKIFSAKTALKFSDAKLLLYILLVVLGEFVFCFVRDYLFDALFVQYGKATSCADVSILVNGKNGLEDSRPARPRCQAPAAGMTMSGALYKWHMGINA